MSSFNFHEEDMMIAIQNDDVNKFMSLSSQNKEWENHYLKEEEQYFTHYATMHKAIKILTYMLQSNVSINKKDSKEQTILHLALEDGFCEFAKLLILKYPVEYCCDSNGNNELFKCVNHNCINCLKLLLNKNKYNWKDVNKVGNNIFHQIAICNNYDAFKFLQKIYNPESFYLGQNDWNILHFCAAHGSEKIFNDLIATKKFDINSLTKNNESILNISIKHCKKNIKKGNYNITEILLKEGALISQDDLKNALDGSNLTLYQKLKTEHEKQKTKSKSLISKRKMEDTEVIDLRKSMGNLGRQDFKRKPADSFININVNINQKKNENEKINMNININKKSDFSFNKNDEVKNPLSYSYSKLALKRNSVGSMYNLLKSDRSENQNKSFQINLKTEYFLNFINLDPNDIKFGDKIYEADMCTIYMGKYLSLSVAIKKYNISKLNEENLTDFQREVNILMCLRHPNIVTFIGKCVYKNQYLILTEYLENRSLKSILEKKTTIPLSKISLLKMTYDIARAVYYLHTRKPPVYHRDLKSSNCLVDEFFRVKLCDFGYIFIRNRISKIFESLPGLKTKTFSTTFWMAPEFIHKRIFTDKSDVYSFGILFWEIMNRDTIPFKNIDNNQFLFGDSARDKRPEIDEKMDKNISSLIKACWHSDPNLRPSMGQVVEELEKYIEIEENSIK